MSHAEPNRYPLAGEVIDGKYRIDRMLGEGGMGAVAGAFHLLRKAPVALKFISPDVVRVPGAVDRFVNEAVAASQIDSDHVVRIFDVGQLPSGLPYIVMEMMSGCDLSELLEREGHGGGLQLNRCVHFVLQILRALQVAHAAGIIHRDLKPSNAFVVVKDGEPDFVKLLDFGISKITQDASESQQHLTQTNTGLGTPLYMSPEQARNARDATGRSDLYSVSAILYELLTGRTPYLAASPNDLLFKLFTSEPDPIRGVRADVPEGLAQIIHRGLSKAPEDRFATATEMAELLAPYADGRSASILSRIRAAGGTRPSQIPSHPPPSMMGLDRTMVATQTDPRVAAAQTSAPQRRTGGTQLNMGVSEPNPSGSGVPAAKRSAAPMIVAGLAIAVMAGAGGVLLMGRGNAANQPPPAASDPPKASVEPPVAAPPSAKPPEVAPAVEPPPVASSAEKKKPPPPAVPDKATPVPKKNPFDVGIVR
jgi:serine/threonine-protein kinase